MRGIAWTFNGANGTHINWDESISDQALVIQKYLLNIVTEQESDPVFPERGTTMLASAIGGAIVSSSALSRITEAAATNTLYFCSYEEYKEPYNAGWYPVQVRLTATDVDVYKQEFSVAVDLKLRDGTELSTSNTFTTNGGY